MMESFNIGLLRPDPRGHVGGGKMSQAPRQGSTVRHKPGNMLPGRAVAGDGQSLSHGVECDAQLVDTFPGPGIGHLPGSREWNVFSIVSHPPEQAAINDSRQKSCHICARSFNDATTAVNQRMQVATLINHTGGLRKRLLPRVFQTVLADGARDRRIRKGQSRTVRRNGQRIQRAGRHENSRRCNIAADRLRQIIGTSRKNLLGKAKDLAFTTRQVEQGRDPPLPDPVGEIPGPMRIKHFGDPRVTIAMLVTWATPGPELLPGSHSVRLCAIPQH